MKVVYTEADIYRLRVTCSCGYQNVASLLKQFLKMDNLVICQGCSKVFFMRLENGVWKNTAIEGQSFEELVICEEAVNGSNPV